MFTESNLRTHHLSRLSRDRPAHLPAVRTRSSLSPSGFRSALQGPPTGTQASFLLCLMKLCCWNFWATRYFPGGSWDVGSSIQGLDSTGERATAAAGVFHSIHFLSHKPLLRHCQPCVHLFFLQLLGDSLGCSQLSQAGLRMDPPPTA